MNVDFSNAMRVVAKLTRAQKLVEATRIIQAALSAKQTQIESGEEELHEPKIERGTRLKRSLAEVIDTLRRAKQETPSHKSKKVLEIPNGAQFLAGSFTGKAGTRTYRLYVPSRHDGRRRPLLVMLHGCKQDPVDFAIGTRMNTVAEEHGMFVVYPHQPKGANPMSCWNWFNPRDQVRDFGEPSIIAGITREIIERFNIDPNQVFVAGLSAGGAMAAVMGATYPDIYAAIGIHSGLLYKSANDVVSAFAVMRGEPGVRATAGQIPRTQMIVFHGDADQTVHPFNAEKIMEANVDTGDVVEQLKSADHKGYTRTLARDRSGKIWSEHWLVHGARHGWSGGSLDGSFTEPRGPDASREMVRFFFQVTEPVAPLSKLLKIQSTSPFGPPTI
jgi:poly(hydroxyalkanoate) depolymerase family esterase